MMSKKDRVEVATVVATVRRRPKRGKKPSKPYPEFPLYAHAGGVWAKRIRGKEHYFGPWGDPQAAMDQYLRERDHLFAGQEPPPEAGGCTLDELVNRFITAQQAKTEAGEITPRQFADYKRDGKRILDCLGRSRPAEMLRPEDFATLRAADCLGRNATTAANIIIRQRSIFKWGYTARLFAVPLNYGGAFSVPSARLRRRALGANGPKDLAAAEIARLLVATAKRPGLVNLHAMILLGINAGLGNTDCSELRMGNLDLKTGFLNYPRPKTDAPRRAILWPQTIAAIKAALAQREKLDVPTELEDRVFVSRQRHAYVGISASGLPVDSVGTEFRKLLVDCEVYRRGIGFYSLRHTFQTVADEGRDFPAIDLVMGHVPDDGGGSSPFAVKMSARYRERISDDRLAAVADRVRVWLFGQA
jgi:integrase